MPFNADGVLRPAGQRRLRTMAAGWLLACAAAAAGAASLIVVRPQDGETIHNNEGRLEVLVVGAADAEGFRAYVDGAPAGGIQRGPILEVDGVDRGEHRLSVDAVDASGRVIASSDGITFYLWHASAQFPSRK